MNRVSNNKGTHFEGEPKLNVKKVAATVIAVLAIIMVVISIKSALTKKVTTKNISVPTTYFSVYTNGKWGVIDNEGKTIINPNYDEMIIIPDKNKDVFICTYNVNYDDSTYNTKVLNSKGEEIFTNYSKVEPIENNSKNKIWYEAGILKFEKEGKLGLIDFSGKEVLAPEYSSISSLQGIEKSIVVEKDSKKGLVNSIGELVVEPKFTEISSLTDDYSNGYIVKDENGKYGIVSPDKKTILENKYDVIDHVCGDNLYVVTEEGSHKIISATGETVLDSDFDKVKSIDGEYIIIEKEGKYGIINKAGIEVVPAEYEDLSYCFDHTYIAKKEEKFGVIGIDNSVKVDFRYVSMSCVKKGNFILADNEQFSTEIIGKNFEVALTDVIVSEINENKGYIRVRINNDYKYYNFNLEEKTAQEVLPTRTLFLYKENGKYGYANNKGDKIVDAIYDDAMEQNEYGFCAVNKDGKWGVLKSNGTVLVEPALDLNDYVYIDFIADYHLYNDLSLNAYTK